jgi:tRNA (guanine-N7-)-methyltransferase
MAMNEGTEPYLRKVKSFVRRAGRITPSQKRGVEQGLSQYGLSVQDGMIDLKAIFGDYKKLTLEIGFGMGDSLFRMAQANPDDAYIGIEVHEPGVGALCNHLLKEDMKNVRIYMTDALDVLSQCIPDESIDIFQLFFPDPWPKKRHHKRRILQPAFVKLVASKLKNNGLFHMATDWEHYAEEALGVLSEAPFLKNTAKDAAFVPRPAHRPETKFEIRGKNKGHKVWDLLFSKVS